MRKAELEAALERARLRVENPPKPETKATMTAHQYLEDHHDVVAQRLENELSHRYKGQPSQQREIVVLYRKILMIYLMHLMPLLDSPLRTTSIWIKVAHD